MNCLSFARELGKLSHKKFASYNEDLQVQILFKNLVLVHNFGSYASDKLPNKCTACFGTA